MYFVAYVLIMKIYAVDKVKESSKVLQFILQGLRIFVPSMIVHPIVLEAFGKVLAKSFSHTHIPSAPKTCKLLSNLNFLGEFSTHETKSSVTEHQPVHTFYTRQAQKKNKS